MRVNKFEVGLQYSRKDIFDVLGIPEEKRRGDWLTGYHKHAGEWFIFAGVGIPGRTGHNYDNKWIDRQLLWRGKTHSRLSQPIMSELLSGKCLVRIFWRTNDRAPFTYAGIARVVKTENTVPVTVLWSFDSEEPEQYQLPEELSPEVTYIEGAAKTVLLNAYERNPAARQVCVEHYGYQCVVCGFSFESVYGELGRKYIHVHHTKSLSEIAATYEVDPIRDLRPVCPNCHSMIHRKVPPLAIEALKHIIQKLDPVKY